MSTHWKRRMAAIAIVAGTVAFLAVVKWVSSPAKTHASDPPDPPTAAIVFVLDSSKAMFPPAGRNYFDLAKEGIAEFLNRPGFLP